MGVIFLGFIGVFSYASHDRAGPRMEKKNMVWHRAPASLRWWDQRWRGVPGLSCQRQAVGSAGSHLHQRQPPRRCRETETDDRCHHAGPKNDLYLSSRKGKMHNAIIMRNSSITTVTEILFGGLGVGVEKHMGKYGSHLHFFSSLLLF